MVSTICCRVASEEQKNEIIRIVDTCYRRLRGAPLPRRALDPVYGEDLAEIMFLKKPKHWRCNAKKPTSLDKLLTLRSEDYAQVDARDLSYPAVRGEQAERRIDPADGNAYTLAEFVLEYGGTHEWDSAAPATDPFAPIVKTAPLKSYVATPMIKQPARGGCFAMFFR